MINQALAAEADVADIDRHFARFIAQFGGERHLVEPAAALLSRAVRDGHICLELTDIFGAERPEGRRSPSKDAPTFELTQSGGSLKLTGVEEAASELKQSRAFGGPAADTPIVIDGWQRLYLRRYWDYQQSLAAAILRKAKHNQPRRDTSGTQEGAIEAALQNQFTIISGGPGTGKTTTVLQILQRLLAQSQGERLRIALAAPTGKAAARLQELLRKMQHNPDLDSETKERMPQNASTIHRLLGPKGDSVYFRHDARNPLPFDVLVVDEASMVALPLMAKLFDALIDTARVILLGDRDQLASVEPGAVLADIAEAASVDGSLLQSSLSVLLRNYRFGNENAIYRLSNAVRTGNADEALVILRAGDFQELGSAPTPASAQLSAQLEEIVLNHYKPYLSEKEPGKALAAFQRFRVLSALREGPFGVRQLNAQIEAILHKRGLISDPSRSYAGMPILVTRNDYQAGLFNGDVGILLPDQADIAGDAPGQLWAWFIGQDNELRRLSPGRLPEYELAYAMTVHKSQGSEFDRVLLILPDRDSPVLTRELVYTGVTRASKRVDVWFNEDVFRASVGRKAVRASGLRDALASNASPLSRPLEQGLLL
jgi:exodeoxyribonuclease V alpha subunit